jgi:signal transduction histidine kinase
MTALGLSGWIVAVIAAGVLGLLLRREQRRLAASRQDCAELDSRLAADRALQDDDTARLAQLESAIEDGRRRLEDEASARDGLLTMINHLPRMLWRRDATLALTFCNSAYARAVGQSVAQVLAEGSELVESADREAARELAARALASKTPQSANFYIVAEGERRLLEITEYPLPDGTLFGYARDLTEMRELQAELERHSEAQRAVLEKLGVGIAILGGDMRLSFHNAAYARLWDLDEAFLLKQPHFSTVLERLRETRRLPEQADFAQYREQLLRQYETLIEPYEQLVHLPDGTTLRTTVHPHPQTGVIFTVEDVTDSLRLERTYNTLLEVQRETLDNLYEGVAVYGADGRLRLSNPAFARIWHLSEDILETQPHVREVVGLCRALFDVSDKAWPELAETLVARATEPESTGGRLDRADGTVVSWGQVPLPDGASLFTYIDVTDTTRVERALRERGDALAAADRLKSEFIANISYELRTPLNTIVGFAEILQHQYFGALNERQAEYCDSIVKASNRLISLINNILDLATIEAGYLELDRKDVDVYELLAGAQQLWQERARALEVELKLECPRDIGELSCDERRMTQAISNLLSNAINFSPGGGTITLSAARGEDEIRIDVTDSGVGIAAEDHARVFDTFAHGESGEAVPRGAKGAGLGLALVKSLVELHGGQVALDPRREKGTQVTCRLPLSHPPATGKPLPPAEPV